MVIDTREELINNLTEAAELEHGLLCQYLFAAFSMKKHPADGITWTQLSAFVPGKGASLKLSARRWHTWGPSATC